MVDIWSLVGTEDNLSIPAEDTEAPTLARIYEPAHLRQTV